MKDGWTTKTLDEVCDFTNGTWKGEKPPFLTVGVIRNTNFTKEGALDDSDIAYIEVEAKKFEKRRLQFGDIILEKSGGGPKQPVGRVVLFDKHDGDFSFSNFTAALRVRDPGGVDFRYLHKYLHWTYLAGVTEGIQSHSTGIRNLNGEAYKAIAFNYPPLPEQQRIVALLDEAFAGLATAKANAERNLQNARALFESHLQAVFSQRGEGWEEQALGDVCSIARGGSPRPISEFITTEPGGINWIKISDATSSDKYIFKTAQAIKPEGVSRSRMVNDGDFLLSNSMSFGRPYIMRTSGCIHDGWLVLTDYAGSLTQDYLYYLLGSKLVFRQFDSLAAGSTVRNLNIELASRVILPVPPLEVQQIIAKDIEVLAEETQRLTHLYERKLAALEELKKSLLHQAFNGEL